jgi:hypothetical protein
MSEAEARFARGDRVYHRRRHEAGTYQYRDPAEPEIATVKFDGGGDARVTENLLVPKSERPR